MDNSSESLGLGEVEDHENQNISFEDGTSLGTKRLHLDSESSADLEVSSLTGYVMSKRIKLENNSEDETSSDLIRRQSCDELRDAIMLGSGEEEGMSAAANDIMFTADDLIANEDDCILIHHMDIKEPLNNLKKALEETHNIDLDGYEFYLQDATPLAGHKTLVEQCVQGCGTVQVNIQLKMESDGTKKINIMDVLKPSDSYLLASGNPAFSPAAPTEETVQPPVTVVEEGQVIRSDKNAIRWVIDTNFRAHQERLQIPGDPQLWEESHVRHWLLWAVRQFNLTGIKLADWKLNGTQLCNLSLEDFKIRVPYDPCDIFWTHLELLRRCHFVAVMQNPEAVMTAKENSEPKSNAVELDKNIMRVKERKVKPASAKPPPSALVDSVNLQPLSAMTTWSASRPGNHGQVQLWQFLLDLLTDKNHRESIQWLGAEGEFKLLEPERVAQLWGIRKNKPSMNYEKLSRALRYYYDGDLIAKVHGKRFVYKFVCDLKQLLGYSAFELNRLVIEAEMRSMNLANDPLTHSIFGGPRILRPPSSASSLS